MKGTASRPSAPARWSARCATCATCPAAATAACWARELGRPLLLAHVVPPRRLPATAVGLPHPALLATEAERLADGRRMLDDIASTIAPVAPPRLPHARALRRGRPASRPARRALRKRVCRGRAATLGLPASAFRRSPATRLLRRSRCPVMVCPSPDAVLASATGADPGGASSTRSASALKKSVRVMTPMTCPSVDDRDEQHAVVEEDLGDLGVGEVGGRRRRARCSCSRGRVRGGSAARFSSALSSERGTKPACLSSPR